MAGGCCGNEVCSCIIRGGAGITVEGSGTQSNPYIIVADLPDFGDVLKVTDSDTVNLTLTGAGTQASPFQLKADATIKLTALADVVPGSPPSIGDVPIWNGTAFSLDPPPAAPAGAVNVSNGITGVGSVPSPIKLATSGVWGSGPLAGLGSDSTIGLATYIDSLGQVRVQPATIASIPWTSVTGKPDVSVVGHTHPASAITDPQNLNVGKIDGQRITTTFSSADAPAVTSAGDLWFFPEGS